MKCRREISFGDTAKWGVVSALLNGSHWWVGQGNRGRFPVRGTVLPVVNSPSSPQPGISPGGLDGRISPLVVELNRRGLRTWSSCQGHPEDFPSSTWWPWIYLSPTRGGASPILLPFDQRGEAPDETAVESMAVDLTELVDGYYREHGIADDEIGPIVYRLYPSPTFVLCLTGVDPRGLVTRWTGALLGDPGRHDFHRRAWREFEMLTHWLRTGEAASAHQLTTRSDWVDRMPRFPRGGRPNESITSKGEP